jgi:hypothetical protein
MEVTCVILDLLLLVDLSDLNRFRQLVSVFRLNFEPELIHAGKPSV